MYLLALLDFLLVEKLAREIRRGFQKHAPSSYDLSNHKYLRQINVPIKPQIQRNRYKAQLRK